jgi:predicted Rossmann fold nucleotide-binding protein DprA/Smf involved in DNA uptake
MKGDESGAVDILYHLQNPTSLDALAEQLGIDVQELRVKLRSMLLEEKIEAKDGMFFIRK